MYVSHVAEDGRIEEVADHLREVAEMAAEFARPFGAESWAYAAGMAHDIASTPQNSRTASSVTAARWTTPRRGL